MTNERAIQILENLIGITGDIALSKDIDFEIATYKGIPYFVIIDIKESERKEDGKEI